MDIPRRKFLQGVIVAPLVAPIFFTLMLTFIGFSFDSKDACDSANLISCLDGFFIVFIIGVPISYFITFIFGVPIYKLAQRFRCLNFWSLSIGGGIVSIIPILIIYAANVLFDDSKKTVAEDINVFLLMFLCGVIVGIVFWFIAARNNETKKGKGES